MVQESTVQYVPHVLMYIYQMCSLKHSTMHPVLHLGEVWWIFHHHFSASERAFSPGSILECSGSSGSVLQSSVEIWEEGWDGMV